MSASVLQQMQQLLRGSNHPTVQKRALWRLVQQVHEATDARLQTEIGQAVKKLMIQPHLFQSETLVDALLYYFARPSALAPTAVRFTLAATLADLVPTLQLSTAHIVLDAAFTLLLHIDKGHQDHIHPLVTVASQAPHLRTFISRRLNHHLHAEPQAFVGSSLLSFILTVLAAPTAAQLDDLADEIVLHLSNWLRLPTSPASSAAALFQAILPSLAASPATSEALNRCLTLFAALPLPPAELRQLCAERLLHACTSSPAETLPDEKVLAMAAHIFSPGQTTLALMHLSSDERHLRHLLMSPNMENQVHPVLATVLQPLLLSTTAPDVTERITNLLNAIKVLVIPPGFAPGWAGTSELTRPWPTTLAFALTHSVQTLLRTALPLLRLEAIINFLSEKNSALPANSVGGNALFILLSSVLSQHVDAIPALRLLIKRQPQLALPALAVAMHRLSRGENSEPLQVHAMIMLLPDLAVDVTSAAAVFTLLKRLLDATGDTAGVALTALYALAQRHLRYRPRLEQYLFASSKGMPLDWRASRLGLLLQICDGDANDDHHLPPDVVQVLPVVDRVLRDEEDPHLIALALRTVASLVHQDQLEAASAYDVVVQPQPERFSQHPAMAAAVLQLLAGFTYEPVDSMKDDVALPDGEIVESPRRKMALQQMWQSCSSSDPLLVRAAVDGLSCFHPSAIVPLERTPSSPPLQGATTAAGEEAEGEAQPPPAPWFGPLTATGCLTLLNLPDSGAVAAACEPGGVLARALLHDVTAQTSRRFVTAWRRAAAPTKATQWSLRIEGLRGDGVLGTVLGWVTSQISGNKGKTTLEHLGHALGALARLPVLPPIGWTPLLMAALKLPRAGPQLVAAVLDLAFNECLFAQGETKEFAQALCDSDVSQSLSNGAKAVFLDWLPELWPLFTETQAAGFFQAVVRPLLCLPADKVCPQAWQALADLLKQETVAVVAMAQSCELALEELSENLVELTAQPGVLELRWPQLCKAVAGAFLRLPLETALRITTLDDMATPAFVGLCSEIRAEQVRTQRASPDIMLPLIRWPLEGSRPPLWVYHVIRGYASCFPAGGKDKGSFGPWTKLWIETLRIALEATSAAQLTAFDALLLASSRWCQEILAYTPLSIAPTEFLNNAVVDPALRLLALPALLGKLFPQASWRREDSLAALLVQGRDSDQQPALVRHLCHAMLLAIESPNNQELWLRGTRYWFAVSAM